MAKDKRFPSPANRPKPGASPVKEIKAPEAKPVVGVKQDLVQVEYSGDNHVVISGTVHHIRKGVNHLPRSVWEKHKSHPALAQLMKDGKLVGPTEAEKSDESVHEDEDDVDPDKDTKDEESEDESGGDSAA